MHPFGRRGRTGSTALAGENDAAKKVSGLRAALKSAAQDPSSADRDRYPVRYPIRYPVQNPDRYPVRYFGEGEGRPFGSRAIRRRGVAAEAFGGRASEAFEHRSDLLT